MENVTEWRPGMGRGRLWQIPQDQLDLARRDQRHSFVRRADDDCDDGEECVIPKSIADAHSELRVSLIVGGIVLLLALCAGVYIWRAYRSKPDASLDDLGMAIGLKTLADADRKSGRQSEKVGSSAPPSYASDSPLDIWAPDFALPAYGAPVVDYGMAKPSPVSQWSSSHYVGSSGLPPTAYHQPAPATGYHQPPPASFEGLGERRPRRWESNEPRRVRAKRPSDQRPTRSGRGPAPLTADNLNALVSGGSAPRGRTRERERDRRPRDEWDW